MQSREDRQTQLNGKSLSVQTTGKKQNNTCILQKKEWGGCNTDKPIPSVQISPVSTDKRFFGKTNWQHSTCLRQTLVANKHTWTERDDPLLILPSLGWCEAGFKRSNGRKKVLNDYNLCLLNTGEPTYRHHSHHSFSVPDISISENKLRKVPWFSHVCKQAVKERKKTHRKLFTHPSAENVLVFKLLKAKARHIIKTQKKTSWQSFCSSLTSKTKPKTVQKAIRNLKGKKITLLFRSLKSQLKTYHRQEKNCKSTSLHHF